MSAGWLTSLWLLPALGGAGVLVFPRRAREAALGTALAALAIAAALPSLGLESLVESGTAWAYGVRYHLRVDGLSLSLVWLTALLTPIALLSAWKQQLSAGFWAAFLFLESALMGVFLAQDLFLFYLFWEASLIPMFFIIGLWGSENRRHAAMKFFLFTFLGSVLLLIALIALVTWGREAGGALNWDMGNLRAPQEGTAALLCFLGLLVGFGVKVPLVPLHTWLPDAHTEAPAAGSIMLAGVMLKMGVYGFLRVMIPAFPKLSWDLLPWLGGLAAINVIYGALGAMAQSDLKRLVAYSSVAHLGFCLLGIFSRTPEGLTGGSLQLVNHGLTTGALFLLVGALYERTHRRGVADFGELAVRAPWMTFFFGVSVLASIGLPGTNGFVGEFMSLAGMTRALPALAVAGVVGVTLAAAYALPAYQAVFWDSAGAGSVSAKVYDLDAREKALMWLLVSLMLGIGLYPQPLLDLVGTATRGLSL